MRRIYRVAHKFIYTHNISHFFQAPTFCSEALTLKKNHTHCESGKFNAHSNAGKVPLQLEQFLLLLFVQFETGSHLFTLLHRHHRV